MAGSTIPASAANLLTATPGSVTLTCSTATGPGNAANVIVKPVTALTGSNTLVVTFGSVGAGLVVTAPSVTTLSTANQAAGITYQVKVANGCAGAASGASAPTFRFSTGAGVDVTVTANVTVTAGTSSPLTTLPSAIALTCTRNPAGPVYTPGPAQKLSVKSATPGGTPFTVENSTFALPSWLTVTPLSGGTASATSVDLSFVAAAGCGSFAAGSTNTFTVHLADAPAPDKLVTVTLQVVPPTTLVATPSPASLSYVKGSGTAGRVDVTITSATTPAPFFSVDATSLPPWLTVDSLSGTVPKSVRFSSTVAADTMAPGNYSTTVRVKVSGQADLTVPITLQLNNPAPKLTVSEGTTRNITWVVGSAVPSLFVTAVSSDSPIPYTIDTGGTLAPIIPAANIKGLAYSFGTPIPVTFSPSIFASAQPGTTLVGTVAITWGSPAATITVTFNVNVQAPGATITSISPASLPTAPAGQAFTLVLSGSGFVTGTDPSLRTKVGIVSGSNFIVEPSIAVNVVNVSNIILTITVPSTPSVNLPFSPTGTGGTVVLGVCNPNGTTCLTPTATTSFTIGSNPIVSAVTSASSFLQVTAPDVQTISPFEMLSVFGSNFCSSGGNGCASVDVLYGIPDATTLAYPSFVSPDAVSATQRKLSVTFQTKASPPVVIATAPILFATNGQINLMAPAALAAQSGNTISMVVSFGFGTGATMKSSAPMDVTVADTNPGIFTVAANGQGDGAILSSAYVPVAPGAEAGMRSTATDSDTVQIYMTGLGAPDSSANNASAGSAFSWSADCVSTSSYLSSLNTFAGTSLTALDGVIISSSLLNSNRLAPCFLSGGTPPTVTIGGVAGIVTYAGWVSDSVAGLYQVNVRLPGSGAGPFTNAAGSPVSAITTPVQLPVVVTRGGRSSQAGVNMWVARRLKVAGPSGAGLTGTVAVAWSSSNNSIVATQGTAPYRYALSSGVLPTGLSLNTTTGAISGTPLAGTAGSYAVTVTATDAANFPLTGKVSFTLTVTGGLVVVSSGTAPYAEVYGTADATVTTVSASGGTFPYTYAMTSPSPVPFGMAIDSSSGVIGVSALTPAGTYRITVTATDSAATPLIGTLTFDIVVALKVQNTTPVAVTAGAASTITTVSATGNTGTVTYTLDATTAALGWVSINSSTGVVSVTTGSVAGTRSVTVTATDGSTATGASAAATGTVTFSLVVN
ncbi:MAG: putative Ig domain-containing protein [Acidobacteria bacterium]|nr:putative Ig domain-containing protein [Acidobacteriota bacterium]